MIVVVTFHSIEDKIVKFFLKNYSEKPIIPNKKEINLNPASRSAKLRYGIKLNNCSDFSELIQKFNYLLEIEELSKKI